MFWPEHVVKITIDARQVAGGILVIKHAERVFGGTAVIQIEGDEANGCFRFPRGDGLRYVAEDKVGAGRELSLSFVGSIA